MGSQASRITQLSVSTTNTSTSVGGAGALIRNETAIDCWIDFDKVATTSTGTMIRRADNHVRFNFEFDRIHAITATDTTTLDIVKLNP